MKECRLPEKRAYLAHLAYNSFINDEYFIPQRVLEANIREYLVDIPETEESSLDIDSTKVLKAIEENHGLLIERARQVYSFSHLTIQEYFTAKHFQFIPEDLVKKAFI